ncbi:rod shape-determining protein [bacterium]|nr:rod shape-determining protein [bacterium]MBU3929596.1 rod shape-determining protein [bacterium]MBU4122984.1 rod shape-determining protein [bacterium]
MTEFLRGLFNNDIGMDLGTSNTLVYVKGRGIVLQEPSVVAIDTAHDRVIAVGVEAKRMLGRTPASIIALRPLKNGVIADFDATERMIARFIKKAQTNFSFLRPRVVIGVPSGITQVERRAVKEAAEGAGAREVHLIEEPKAAAIGSDMPIAEPSGRMIVDIGGGTTEMAVISLGEMVISRSIRVGGDAMDEAIEDFFKKKHNLLIGEGTAEQTKINVGSAFPLEDELKMNVKGRDQVSGLPKTIEVSSQNIRQALSVPVKRIVDAIKATLEETPAELSSDLVENGIVLAGGGSLLKGFENLIQQETYLPVRRAPDPLVCVALGAGKYLETLEEIKRAQKEYA